MTTCEICKGFYPDRFVQPLFVGGVGYQYQCVDCALKTINRIHCLPKNTPFKGERAYDLHKSFKEWKVKYDKIQIVSTN